MKILTILGARPQFIKAGFVSSAIMEYNQSEAGSEKMEEVIVHTGQHFDANMSDIFFKEMQIPRPDYNLNINGLGHDVVYSILIKKGLVLVCDIIGAGSFVNKSIENNCIVTGVPIKALLHKNKEGIV